ncbi:MAG TPA: hypothetical protein VGY31_00495, partial [Terriglobia bacterium]|nr:hypothetical protein [Terriglobia bacterium]
DSALYSALKTKTPANVFTVSGRFEDRPVNEAYKAVISGEQRPQTVTRQQQQTAKASVSETAKTALLISGAIV